MTLQWRPMRPDDIEAVTGVARLSFPDHFEDRACFENRLALYPRGCFVLADGDEPARGYLIAYPWKAESAPPLNTVIEGLPAQPDLIYLHDLALHPEARGGGVTGAIVERLAEQATEDGWPAIALVAVNDAVGFWSRHGFVEQPAEAMAAKLASYGADARYMLRPL
ncbi:GCN5 family acetyltransferase [Brevundimonas sp. GW460-12-10-14-LB2]|jgi:ribosomal protein S18 acetylase RimI-like enzyme|uniref:GNAT family N-acetyltransferase n=1 Tax=Brevundimonas TaxID=41275 RepID=UPI0007BCD13C|nr:MULTISPECIES: GNAT family N-acetyltransferase [Brevundimonas]ANC54586.1 GCN5 family acetyltransferase [Brevundimonas sp. GW460-12-10-14-LB2]MEA3473691.1 GNAT family N-acetyltransferase [Pseudomonadota bacterium]